MPGMMTDRSLIHAVDDLGVATVTLNRPAMHNAFDDALIAELDATFAALDSHPKVRAVVLEASGKSFSAGADLAWMQRMAAYSLAENEADAAALAGMMRRLDRLSKPTVAVVQGAAFGGGVGLVACCDIVVASTAARFCLSEVKLGLVPAVISPYVVAAIGPHQARRYFQTGEMFSAVTAQRIGLVHDVVAADELAATRDGVIAALLEGAPGAQAEAKALVFAVDVPVTDDVLAQTVRLIAKLRAGEEGREGLAAFLQKRQPAWSN